MTYVLATVTAVMLALMLWLAAHRRIGHGWFDLALWTVLTLLMALLFRALFFSDAPLWVPAAMGLVLGPLYWLRWYMDGGDWRR